MTTATKVTDSLENICINHFIKTQQKVSVYLKHGIRLKNCLIIANTEEALIIKSDIPQIIYKKNVSTIQPEMKFIQYE